MLIDSNYISMAAKEKRVERKKEDPLIDLPLDDLIISILESCRFTSVY